MDVLRLDFKDVGKKMAEWWKRGQRLRTYQAQDAVPDGFLALTSIREFDNLNSRNRGSGEDEENAKDGLMCLDAHYFYWRKVLFQAS